MSVKIMSHAMAELATWHGDEVVSASWGESRDGELVNMNRTLRRVNGEYMVVGRVEDYPAEDYVIVLGEVAEEAALTEWARELLFSELPRIGGESNYAAYCGRIVSGVRYHAREGRELDAFVEGVHAAGELPPPQRWFVEATVSALAGR